MNPTELRAIRDTGVQVSTLGLGTGPLGNLFAPVDDQAAQSVISEALRRGITYLDTAPVYGLGLAEQRLGRSLVRVDRNAVVVSTKVGRLLRKGAPPEEALFHDGVPFFKTDTDVNPVWDFSRHGIETSLAESLERLQTDRIDIAFIHEPPDELFDEAARTGYQALRNLQRDGLIGAVGLGWDRPDRMTAFLRRADCDCVLLASRYTLLDQTGLDELLPLCQARRTAVIAGGVFNSGILANPNPNSTYDYLPASDELIEHARRLKRVCAQAGVPLIGAALNFPFTHPSVVSVVVGARTVAELDDDIRGFTLPIPDSLWPALVGNAFHQPTGT